MNFFKIETTLPEKCQTCEWIHLCHGGCPRNRSWNADLQSYNSDYFCESYQQLYAYAHDRMVSLSEKVQRNLFCKAFKLIIKGNNQGEMTFDRAEVGKSTSKPVSIMNPASPLLYS